MQATTGRATAGAIARIAGLALVALALLAPAAQASTLTKAGSGLLLTATDGEINAVTMTPMAGQVVINDPSNGIVVDPAVREQQCTRIDGFTLHCFENGGIQLLTLNLGDADDSIRFEGAMPWDVSVNGQGGDDTFTFAPGMLEGNDVDFRGGVGTDTLGSVAGDGTAALEMFLSPNSLMARGESDFEGSVTLIERFDGTGTDLRDTFIAAGWAGTIDFAALAGADLMTVGRAAGPYRRLRVVGGRGLDRLYSVFTEGNDVIRLQPFTVRTGARVFAIHTQVERFTLDAWAGNDTIILNRFGGAVLGGGGHDRLVGSMFPDGFFGGPGNDVAFGGGGNDRLFGQGGNDRLYGGAGRDRLFGGPGMDGLWGGAGIDVLRGGTGDDVERQ